MVIAMMFAQRVTSEVAQPVEIALAWHAKRIATCAKVQPHAPRAPIRSTSATAIALHIVQMDSIVVASLTQGVVVRSRFHTSTR